MYEPRVDQSTPTQPQNYKIIRQLYIDNRVPMIRWLVKTYLLEVEQATEITQKVFVAYMEKSIQGDLPNFATSSNLKSYLFGIAKNKVREWQRNSHKTLSITEEQLHIAEVQEEVWGEDYTRRVHSAVTAFNQLGEKCQELLRLALVFKVPMKEIAAQLEYENASTAKNLKYKCLLRLRKLYLQLDQ